ncbi:hypothetical protein PG991_012132 [Apiospora marii]|uniref:Uncharacterized protein n=1 Tax=Apiospora marii TaxID=335849 RepID=A0ABR1R8S6_9PEZI
MTKEATCAYAIGTLNDSEFEGSCLSRRLSARQGALVRGLSQLRGWSFSRTTLGAQYNWKPPWCRHSSPEGLKKSRSALELRRHATFEPSTRSSGLSETTKLFDAGPNEGASARELYSRHQRHRAERRRRASFARAAVFRLAPNEVDTNAQSLTGPHLHRAGKAKGAPGWKREGGLKGFRGWDRTGVAAGRF